MGVMQCNHKECDRILCTRYSHDHGYICDTHFEELVYTDPVDIDEFMGNKRDRGMHDRSYYDRIFVQHE